MNKSNDRFPWPLFVAVIGVTLAVTAGVDKYRERKAAAQLAVHVPDYTQPNIPKAPRKIIVARAATGTAPAADWYTPEDGSCARSPFSPGHTAEMLRISIKDVQFEVEYYGGGEFAALIGRHTGNDGHIQERATYYATSEAACENLLKAAGIVREEIKHAIDKPAEDPEIQEVTEEDLKYRAHSLVGRRVSVNAVVTAVPYFDSSQKLSYLSTRRLGVELYLPDRLLNQWLEYYPTADHGYRDAEETFIGEITPYHDGYVVVVGAIGGTFDERLAKQRANAHTAAED